jgi:cytochrome c nitrite reductase small subunit
MKFDIIVFLGLVTGIFSGLGTYTFVYAKGYSYLGNDPQTCANCHVMQVKLDGWIKSPHKAVATCNDCHTPHDLIGKYETKANNGFWHSYYFTTGDFPDNIRITRRSHAIVEENCRRCHADIVEAMDGAHVEEDKLTCVTCHDDVGH